MATPLDSNHALSRDTSRLESLLESAQLLHSSLDLEDLLRHLLRSVMGRVLVGRGLIAVEQNGVMRVALGRGVKNFHAGDLFDEGHARDAGLSYILSIGDAEHRVGFLALGRPASGMIEAEEEESLKALLGIAASGIANARAHAETQRVNLDLDQKVQELRALLDLVRGLTATLEPDAVASLLMLTLAGRWAVRKYALAAWKEGHPIVTRHKGLTLHSDLHQHQELLSGLPEAVFIENLPDGDFKAALASQGAALVFPLCTANATNGLVVLGARPGDLRYSEADLEFGAGLVAQAGVAFANSWYVRETLERKKLEQELALAASIQEKLFPDQMPKLDGYDLAAHNLPARQCGGDYYDALPIDGTDASSAVRPHLFCVADVSGKGLPASLLMSNVQATLRALLGRMPSLADLAARINELMYATTPGNKYVTAVMVEFDPASGAVRYVNAGHNGGVLVRAGGEHEWLKPTGTPLGLIAGLPYEEASCEVQPGDLLALFSDGIPEAQDTSENEFGEERLVEYLRQARHQCAAGIVAGAFEQVSEFAGTAPQYDDITLLVIKRTA